MLFWSSHVISRVSCRISYHCFGPCVNYICRYVSLHCFIILLHATIEKRWILLLKKMTLSRSIASSNSLKFPKIQSFSVSTVFSKLCYISLIIYILILGIWFFAEVFCWILLWLQSFTLYKPKYFIVTVLMLHTLTTKFNAFVKRSKLVLISFTSTICK